MNNKKNMPLTVFLTFSAFLITTQPELTFFFGLSFCDYFINLSNVIVFDYINTFSSIYYSKVNYDFGFKQLNYMKLDYDYNYRTYFTQTYLHAAYTHHMKPYKNLFSVDRMFGDHNVRTYGKSKKHARSVRNTKIFLLLYSHTLNCYAFNAKLTSVPFVMFYFKKHHFYSFLEMLYASLYLGMVYFFSLTYTRMIEDGSLNMRETEEVDEEEAQNHWYFFREDRRGVVEPSMDDNEEVDFAYPQHPVEWDDNGHFYRWEMYFFMFMFSFLVSWGVSQSAASMFYYDNFIDLHFMGWGTTLAFVFVFWRIFFLVQFFSYFNRFNFHRFFYTSVILPIFVFISSYFVKFIYSFFWPMVYTSFSRLIKITAIESSNVVLFEDNLFKFSLKENLKRLLIKFYRYLYASFQKNLNFFEKRNLYDYFLSSSLTFIFNSRSTIDKVFYYFYKKDRLFSNIQTITSSYMDNYRFHRGFFFPKNMYLTTNKISFPFTNFLPPIFPLYLDHFNAGDLPIWGADFFFNLSQNVFSVSESNESWFFAKQYNTHFGRIGHPNVGYFNTNRLNNFVC